LLDGWVHYLSQKNGAGGAGQTWQSAWLVKNTIKDKIVVEDEV
jgi:hypothetical protein